MHTKQHGQWIVDLDKHTCRNTENELVILFEKKGMSMMGTIKNMPIKLVQQWARDPNCKDHIRKALIEADEIFSKVYFTSEIAGGLNGEKLSA
jgi:hypothetical protein